MKFTPKPSFIRLDITSKCNFDCGGCYRLRRNIRDLSTDKILKIIDEVKKFKVNRIIFSGGEPFLRGDLEKIILYASKKRIKCDIVSNGVLITEKHLPFLKKYVSSLGISLDGHNEKINSKTRPKSSFDKVIKTLILLKENEIPFNLITTISESNFNYLEKIIRFGKKIRAKEHHFVRFVPIGQGSKHKNQYLSDKKWIEAIKTLKNHSNLLFDEKWITGDCKAGKDFLCLLANGDIIPCTRKYQKKWKLGNIFKNNIKEVWHTSYELRKFRKTKRSNCLKCNF